MLGFRALVVLALLCLQPSLPAGARIEQAPNSRVAVDVPDGFQAATRFAGFLHAASGASLVVFEAPGHAYEQMASGFTAEALAKRNITNAAAHTLARAAPYLSMRAEQATARGVYNKLFVLFREHDVTVLLTANVPRTALENGGVRLADLEKALASARVGPATESKPPFSIAYLGPFKDAGVVMGSGRLYTLDGRLEPPDPKAARAMFIIAPSLDQRPVIDPGPIAEQGLKSLADFKDVAIKSVKAVEIAGMTGLRHEAEAAHAGDQARVRILQVLLAGKEGGYVRMVAIAPAAEASRLVPEFMKMADSLTQVR